MATVTVYFLNTAATAPNWFGRVQDGGTAPGGALSAFGWTVGKTAITTAFWRGRLGATAPATVAQAASYIASATGPAQGTGAGATTAGDSFRSDNPLSGTFAAGNWNFTFGMRTGTATTAGRVRLHVWAAANATGVGARKLTSAVLVGTTVTMASASTTYNSTVTWAAPQVVLDNEYLFTQIEWEETTAGTANQCNALFYQASFVTTDYIYTIRPVINGAAGSPVFSTPTFFQNPIPLPNPSNLTTAPASASASTIGQTHKLATPNNAIAGLPVLGAPALTAFFPYYIFTAIDLAVSPPTFDQPAFTFGKTFLDAGYTSSNITLSGNNLIATRTVATDGVNYSDARSQPSRNSNYLYAEVQCFAKTSDSPGIGVCHPGMGLDGTTTWLGHGTDSIGYFLDGAIWLNNVLVQTIEPVAVGDWVGIDVNYDLNTVWFRNITKGGAWSVGHVVAGLSPATNVGVSLWDSGESFAFNFDAPFRGDPGDPLFTRWDGSAPNYLYDITAVGFGVSAPIISAPALVQTTPIVASALAVQPPTIASAAFKQRHALGASPLAVQPPACGTPTLTINAVPIVANNLSATAPALGAPALKPTSLLAASNLATAPPVEAAAAFSQAQALGASALASSPPTFTVPAFNRTLAVTASPLAVSAPTVGAAAFAQPHTLIAIAPVVASPVLGLATISQAGVMAALPLVATPPTLGVGALTQKHVLTASTTTTSPPSIASADLLQQHRFSATSVTTTPPSVGASALGQQHVLTAISLTVVIPAIPAAVLGQSGVMACIPIAVTSPTIGAPQVGQKHVAAAQGLTANPPALGSPALGKVLSATALAVGAPVISPPLLTKVLTAAPLSAGALTLGTPACALRVFDLAASALAIGPPTIPALAIGQSGVMAAVPPVVGSPVLGAPAIGQRHVLPAAVGASSGVPWKGGLGLFQVPAPALSQQNTLTALPLAIGAPALGPGVLRQEHRLIAPAASAGRSVLGIGNIGQAGVMAAIPLWVGSPVLPAIAPRERQRFTGNGFTVGPPFLGIGVLGVSIQLPRPQSAFAGRFKPLPAVLQQAHQLTAQAASAGAPRVPVATMFERESFREPPLVVSSPVLGAPVLALVANFTAVGLTLRPELGRPPIGQEHRVRAATFSVGSLWIGYPRLGKPPIALDAIDLSVGIPVFGALHFVPLDRLLAVVNITSRQRLMPITGARGATTLSGQRGGSTITAGRSNGTIIGRRGRNII